MEGKKEGEESKERERKVSEVSFVVIDVFYSFNGNRKL